MFPQFGAGLNGPTGLPSHGFARISKWNLAAGGFDDLSFESTPFSGRVFADFSLESKDIYVEGHDSPWLNGDISFRLVFRVELGPGSLRTSLTVTNTHDASTVCCVSFQHARSVHVYAINFSICSVVLVLGGEGSIYVPSTLSYVLQRPRFHQGRRAHCGTAER